MTASGQWITVLRGPALCAMEACALLLIVIVTTKRIVGVVAAAAVPVRSHTVLGWSPAP